MFTLVILILIQFIFCLFFFLYFRYKITQQFQLKEYQREINSLISLFNRQAEKHITYLESLLEDSRFKNFSDDQKSNFQPIKKLDQTSKEFKTDNHTNLSHSHNYIMPEDYLDIRGRHPIEMKKNPSLPPQPVYSFHSHLHQSEDNRTNGHGKEMNSAMHNQIASPSFLPLTSNKQKTNEKNEISDTVMTLYEQGLNIYQIAKKLSLSTAEIKLIFKLKKT